MEVRKGFKQTEVGIIPEDWECTSVDHLVNIGVLEKPLDGNHGEIHPKSSDFVEYGIPFVMANNVQNGHVDLENCSFIRKEQADRLRTGFSYPNDVLLTHKATIGNTAIVGEISSEYIMLTPQVTYYRVADKTRLSNYYLRHFFDSSAFQKIMVAKSGGGTRAYIGVSAQRQLPVVLPSTLAEQEAIADALSDADALIESLETLLAKKRQVKQGAMSELLSGKKRLPEFDKKQSYKQTPFGAFPKDWEIVPLKEVSSMHGRIGWQGLKQTEFTMNSDEPFLITGMNFKDGEIRWEEVYHISEERYGIAKEIQLKIGDVLMTKDGTIGKILFVDHIPYPGKASLNSHLLVFRPINKRYVPKFMFYQLNYRTFHNHIELEKSGTTFFGITQEAVGKYNAFLPSIAEQTAIVEILSDMDAEIRAVEEKLSKARRVKAGMMSALLGGRVRLV